MYARRSTLPLVGNLRLGFFRASHKSSDVQYSTVIDDDKDQTAAQWHGGYDSHADNSNGSHVIADSTLSVNRLQSEADVDENLLHNCSSDEDAEHDWHGRPPASMHSSRARNRCRSFLHMLMLYPAFSSVALLIFIVLSAFALAAVRWNRCPPDAKPSPMLPAMPPSMMFGELALEMQSRAAASIERTMVCLGILEHCEGSADDASPWSSFFSSRLGSVPASNSAPACTSSPCSPVASSLESSVPSFASSVSFWSPFSASSTSSPLPSAASSALPIHPTSFVSSLHWNSSAPGVPLLKSDPAFRSERFATQLRSFGYSSDPLPTCTALNVNLTLNLLEYVRHVQAPHLYADCQRLRRDPQRRCINSLYMKQREYNVAMNGPGGSVDDRLYYLQPRWVETQNAEGDAGGWADRLKGMFTHMLWALATDKAIAIDSGPVPIHHIWLPSVLPWVDHARIDPQWAGIGEGSFVKDKYQGLENRHSLLTAQPDGWYERMRATELFRLNSNYNEMRHLLRDKHYQQRYIQLGFNVSDDMDVYFGCLHEFMFRPSRELAAVLQPLLATLQRPPLPRTSNWSLESQLLQQYNWDTKAAQPAVVHAALETPAAVRGASTRPFLFCSQIRMGAAAGKGHSTFADTEAFVAASTFPYLLTNLQRLMANLSVNHSSRALYVTSDSDEVFDVLPSYFSPAQYMVVQLPGPTVHIDKVAGMNLSTVLSGFIKVVATHYLLGECDAVVISPTGFGATAVWRTAWKAGRKTDGSRQYSTQWRMDKYGKLTAFHHGPSDGRP